MKITGEIINALKAVVDEMGSPAQVARKTGVSPSNLSRYLNGEIQSISDGNWDKLKEYITPHLDNIEVIPADSKKVPPKAPDTIRNTPELRECIKDAMLREGVRDASELNRAIGYDSVHSIERLLSGKLNWFPDVLSAVFEALKINHDDAPISPAERMMLLPDGFFNNGAILVRPLPVVAWANAASHLAMLSSSDSCVPWKWDPETTETIPVPVGTRKNTQVFRVTGLSMEPTIHDDDIILAEQRFSFDEISDKKVVVVKFIDCGKYPDCIVCKRLRKFGKQLTLTSDNPAGLDFEIDPHDVEWLGVVVQFLSNRGL